MGLTAANIAQDTVRDTGSSEQRTLQGLLTYKEINRGCIVTGLTAAGVSPLLASAAVIALMQQMNPVGTAHPSDSQCTARNYSAQQINSDDAMAGIVQYVFNTPGADNSDWLYESDTYGSVEETDAQFNASGGIVTIPISNYILGLQNPGDPTPQVPQDGSEIGQLLTKDESPQRTEYASVTRPFTKKTYRYTRPLYSISAAQAFDNATIDFVDHLNSVTYTGLTSGPAAQNLSLPPGTVWCSRASITIGYQGKRTCVVEMVYDPRGHQPYATYISAQTNARPGNCWRAAQDGSYPANGVVRTSAFPVTDLGQLLNSIGSGVQLPFGGGGTLPTGD